MSGPRAVDEEAPWRAGLRGARANLWPGLVLQATALGLVLAYYRHAPTRELLTRLAEFRAEAGFGFGIVSTGIFGGLIPWAYLRARGKKSFHTWTQGAALIAFWSYKGFEFELFYRLLAHVVGTEVSVSVVAIKMFLDQFVYSPLLAIPPTVLFYAWVETHFDASHVWADVRRGGWYRRRVLPVLISNLVVWVPTVCIIYSLPTPLQLPLQNLVLCFFTLLLAHISADADKTPATAKR